MMESDPLDDSGYDGEQLRVTDEDDLLFIPAIHAEPGNGGGIAIEIGFFRPEELSIQIFPEPDESTKLE